MGSESQCIFVEKAHLIHVKRILFSQLLVIEFYVPGKFFKILTNVLNVHLFYSPVTTQSASNLELEAKDNSKTNVSGKSSRTGREGKGYVHLLSQYVHNFENISCIPKLNDFKSQILSIFKGIFLFARF